MPHGRPRGCETTTEDRMGDVINLSERRDALRSRGRAARERSRAEFFFDLACPFTYLAAERVDRAFDEVVWTPVTGVGRAAAQPDRAIELRRRAAEQDAAALRLPLVWPEPHVAAVPLAMRVAAFASEAGRGYEFTLAAS